jgi:DNA-binding response OmpR family regulator
MVNAAVPFDSREAAPEASARHRVLVVDDNLDAARTLQQLLINEGYQVMAFGTPMKAMELARVFTPHFAILDIAMPIMDGLSLCSFFRRWHWGKKMHIIAVSGRDYTDEEVKAAGFDGYFMKPLDWGVLKVELARVVARRPFRIGPDPDRQT